MLFLFTTPYCPYCPQAKKILLEKGIQAELIDASKPTGRHMAIEYDIARVPTLIEVNDEGILLQRFDGIEKIITSSCLSQDFKK